MDIDFSDYFRWQYDLFKSHDSVEFKLIEIQIAALAKMTTAQARNNDSRFETYRFPIKFLIGGTIGHLIFWVDESHKVSKNDRLYVLEYKPVIAESV